MHNAGKRRVSRTICKKPPGPREPAEAVVAGSLAVLTLIHELGHAVAARNAGAKAEISLDFLAGYAAYVPTRPISRLEQRHQTLKKKVASYEARLSLNPQEQMTLQRLKKEKLATKDALRRASNDA